MRHFDKRMNIPKLSVVILAKNSESIIANTLSSARIVANEIIVVDNYSTDKTYEIAKSYGAKIIKNDSENLAILRTLGVNKAASPWILILDSDEIISPKLALEIKKAIRASRFDSFYLTYLNHFFSIPLTHGGEDYKVLRLFKKGKAKTTKNLLHEQFHPLTKSVSTLKNPVMHYSYRSLPQLFTKFTNYAVRSAKEKREKGEKSSLKKLTLYPLHMFWSRFIESKGYKDGILRIMLDFAFAYMEFLTYFLLLFKKNIKKN